MPKWDGMGHTDTHFLSFPFPSRGKSRPKIKLIYMTHNRTNSNYFKERKEGRGKKGEEGSKGEKLSIYKAPLSGGLHFVLSWFLFFLF